MFYLRSVGVRGVCDLDAVCVHMAYAILHCARESYAWIMRCVHMAYAVCSRESYAVCSHGLCVAYAISRCALGSVRIV